MYGFSSALDRRFQLFAICGTQVLVTEAGLLGLDVFLIIRSFRDSLQQVRGPAVHYGDKYVYVTVCDCLLGRQQLCSATVSNCRWNMAHIVDPSNFDASLRIRLSLFSGNVRAPIGLD